MQHEHKWMRPEQADVWLGSTEQQVEMQTGLILLESIPARLDLDDVRRHILAVPHTAGTSTTCTPRRS